MTSRSNAIPPSHLRTRGRCRSGAAGSRGRSTGVREQGAVEGRTKPAVEAEAKEGAVVRLLRPMRPCAAMRQPVIPLKIARSVTQRRGTTRLLEPLLLRSRANDCPPPHPWIPAYAGTTKKDRHSTRPRRNAEPPNVMSSDAEKSEPMAGSTGPVHATRPLILLNIAR